MQETRAVIAGVTGFLLLAQSCAAGAASIPESLTRAIASRSAERIRTARLEVVYRLPDGDGELIRFFTWKCAGAAKMRIDHGGVDGPVLPYAKDPNLAQYATQIYLDIDGSIWTRPDDAIYVSLVGLPNACIEELRHVGLDPLHALFDLAKHGIPRGGDTSARFDEQRDGEWIRVTADYADGARDTWWIAPDRDWNVVRSTIRRDGEVTLENVVTLAQFDGFWFPAKVERFLVRNGERRSDGSVEIIDAQFNRPEHPRALGFDELGVEPGMSVMADPNSGFESGMWGGDRVLSPGEAVERIQNGTLKRGPTFMRYLAKQRIKGELRAAGAAAARPAPASQPVRPETEWERLTMEFISRHKLDAGQAERALIILRDCQSLADQVRRRSARAAGDGGPAGDAGLAGDAKPGGASPSGMTAGGAPASQPAGDAKIDQIRDGQLIPRLESLLRSSQRDEP